MSNKKIKIKPPENLPKPSPEEQACVEEPG